MSRRHTAPTDCSIRRQADIAVGREQRLRGKWLSNRVSRCYDDILGHCCYAWYRLAEQPWTAMSIELRDWTRGF
jgi:hypothetical protein